MANKYFRQYCLIHVPLQEFREAGSGVSSTGQIVKEGICTIIGTSYKTVDNDWFKTGYQESELEDHIWSSNAPSDPARPEEDLVARGQS